MGPLGQLRYDLRQLVKHRTATNASEVNWFFRHSYVINHKKNDINENLVPYYTFEKEQSSAHDALCSKSGQLWSNGRLSTGQREKA